MIFRCLIDVVRIWNCTIVYVGPSLCTTLLNTLKSTYLYHNGIGKIYTRTICYVGYNLSTEVFMRPTYALDVKRTPDRDLLKVVRTADSINVRISYAQNYVYNLFNNITCVLYV